MQHLAGLAIEALWIAWLALWTYWARGVKPVIRRESWATRALHLGPLFLGTLLIVDLNDLPAALNRPLLPGQGLPALCGLVLTAGGLGFAVWARLSIGTNWSGNVTLKAGHELVTGGPYRLVRHPIYTGLILAFCGTALVMDAWRCWLAAAIITASFMRKLRTEEEFMRAQFGTAYTEYAARVPALVPRLGPAPAGANPAP